MLKLEDGGVDITRKQEDPFIIIIKGIRKFWVVKFDYWDLINKGKQRKVGHLTETGVKERY